MKKDYCLQAPMDVLKDFVGPEYCDAEAYCVVPVIFICILLVILVMVYYFFRKTTKSSKLKKN